MSTVETPPVIEEPAAPTATRSPSDVLRLVVASVLLLSLIGAELWFGDTLVKFGHDLLRGLASPGRAQGPGFGIFPRRLGGHRALARDL